MFIDSDDIWREWTVRLLEVEELGDAPSEGRGACGGTSREAICKYGRGQDGTDRQTEQGGRADAFHLCTAPPISLRVYLLAVAARETHVFTRGGFAASSKKEEGGGGGGR